MPATINVESGAGTDSTCNSYVTLAECSAYHEEMGNTAWASAVASPDSARITAIIRACRAIDRLYGKKFTGYPKNYGTQAMQWPRSAAVVVMDNAGSVSTEYGLSSFGTPVADTLIPAEVKQACYEAALVELASPGDMTPSLDRGGKISSVSAGAVSVTFEDGATPMTIRTAIEGILRPLLKMQGNELVLG